MRIPLDLGDVAPRLNELGTTIVDCIGEVRRELGAGLVESVYLPCLVAELRARGLACEVEVPIPVIYKGTRLQKAFRIDLLVEDCVVLEAQAVEELHPAHFAQLLTYLRLSGKPLGYLVNFNAIPLGSGIHRRVNTREAR